jgi:cytochrome c553
MGSVMRLQKNTRAGKVLVAALLACAATAVSAQSVDRLKTVFGDPGSRSAAIEAGKKAASFCANCHGPDGNSRQGEVPNLAGQNPVYLLNQVHKFYTGERRDQWMEPAIKLLSDVERLNIVVYYSSMQVSPASSAPPNEAGRALYQRVCSRCHGDQARGGERFPRLAGQQHTYLIRSLTRYRDRTGNRMEPEMLAMTAALKDEDIKAVADYLSSLR